MGNSLLYISLLSVAFGRVRPQGAPCFSYKLIAIHSFLLMLRFFRVFFINQREKVLSINTWNIQSIQQLFTPTQASVTSYNMLIQEIKDLLLCSL